MSKNGKGFEKFLREEGPAKSQFFRAANKSPEEEAAYQAAQRAFDLQLQREKATSQVVDKTFDIKDETGKVIETKHYKERVPRTPEPGETVPSEQEVEKAFETSRQKSAKVDDIARQNKRISPAYWVTNADFEQTFNRPYNPMSKEDQRDFFGLVGSSKPRRYTEGPAAGQVIPSTRRPDFIPTYQDVDGVRVPESAFSRLKKVTPETADERETVKIGQYEIKPVYPEAEQKQARARNFTNVEQMRVSDEIALQAPVIPLEQRPEGGNEVFPPAPAPDPAPAPEGLAPQQAAKTPPTPDLSGVGLYGGVLGQMRFARGQKPSQPEVGAMGPTRSEAELSKMMRDAREAPSAVGPSMYPAIPANMAARLADYVPPPEPPSAPAPDPESLSDLELAKMKRDAKESEPSGLSQAISLSKGVGQFAKNLDQAAGRKIKEAGQKVSDIAKQFRTQRDENFRKNIERLEAKGIKVPGFDVGEKGFGQHGNYPAQGSEDFQGKLLSRSLVDLPLGPGETIEDRRKEIVQYYKEKMLPSEYAKTWGFASEEPSPELPGRFDMDPIRSKTPVTTQSFNSPQKRSSTTAPQQVAGAISGNQKKQFAQSSPISQEMASRMISVQTPGQVSTQLTGRPLTTQERDRFKFDSGVPASVAASMNKVTPVRTPLGQEPLTQTEKPIGGGKKGEREMASFTKGMSDAEVNAEFEKLFGKENKDLSIEMKKDMIERFRLGELMQQGGGIMGMNPMYEMEIDPDTGELKLNPKKRD